jgi:hypothetical protein
MIKYRCTFWKDKNNKHKCRYLGERKVNKCIEKGCPRLRSYVIQTKKEECKLDKGY